MSNRYKGGIISATPPTTTGGESGTASGAWTLEQQMQAQAAGLWPAQPTGPYIEQVFSTYLYTGNGSTQTINNGIDLAGKGGLVWVKKRSGAQFNILQDTVRGAGQLLYSNSTDAQGLDPASATTFSSTGFTTGSDNNVNESGSTYASWTFREQPKFFDVVTYTGNGANRTIAHNLGSVPGCIMVKSVTNVGGWSVYHRGLFPPVAAGAGTAAPENYVILNTNAQVDALSTVWNNTGPTDTVFSVGTNAAVNTSGQSYIAYIFAHNAGGFGLTGTDNVITCGQYQGLGDGTGPVVNLGFEPQWLLVKAVKDAGATRDWYIIDNMRGWTEDGQELDLSPNTSGAETSNGTIRLNATGFQPMGNDGSIFNGRFVGYIYIAIRRGPMRTPTTGTSVFAAQAPANTNIYTSNFPVDLLIRGRTDGSSDNAQAWSRLTGRSAFLLTSATNAENFSAINFDSNIRIVGGSSDSNNIYRMPWMFRRAPGFFDVVCYTGSGTTTTQTHNLQAVPELIIVKRRNASAFWFVYSATYGRNFYSFLNDTQGFASDPGNSWGTTNPTSTTFSLSPLTETNASGSTYVAYLFASCPGVSKVGSYTGTGTTQTINCGFTAGARFVMIKRTDSTGAWYVWDTARGMIPANDPYLLLNSTAAEVTNTDFVDTAATGFEITSTAPAAINASGGTFIFLAIA